MIFRRAKQDHVATELDKHDRRRAERETAGQNDADPSEQPGPDEQSGPDESAGPPLPTGNGPYDANEIDLAEASKQGTVDMGGLIVRPRPGMELRLQVDEKSQKVMAAVLVQGNAGVEMRAYAAPRSGGLWDDVRQEVSAETTRRGGVVNEDTGRFGPEITVVVPTRNSEGKSVSQTSRITGVDGPRWFLRATFLGQAATDSETARPFEEALADVIVVRGQAPMPPREMIALSLPEGVQQVTKKNAISQGSQGSQGAGSPDPQSDQASSGSGDRPGA